MHIYVHSSTIPRHGNNLNAHQQMNGQRRCGIYIYICVYTHTGIVLSHNKDAIKQRYGWT